MPRPVPDVVYLNWILGLRALGCQVIWLESIGHEPSRGMRRNGTLLP